MKAIMATTSLSALVIGFALATVQARSLLSDAQPTVSLYYESLCPGCHEFITSQLAPTYQKLSAYFHLELVAFGNAEVESNDTFECQHGPDECYGNAVQACLLARPATTYEVELTFITCMIEQPNSDDTHAAAKKCATDLKLDWDSLSTCADGPQGVQLILSNANRTAALQPPHQYVPWIVVNGNHTESEQNQMQSNMLKYLCDNYLASLNLPECKQSSFPFSQTPESPRCPIEE